MCFTLASLASNHCITENPLMDRLRLDRLRERERELVGKVVRDV